MVNAFPAIQISTIDLSVSPQNNVVAQIGGIGIYCATGVVLQDVVLAPGASSLALAFPTGVSAAAFIYISAITTTDLIVKVGSGSPVSLSLPANQGMMLYGLTSSQVSLNSVAGGQVQYAVGG